MATQEIKDQLIAIGTTHSGKEEDPKQTLKFIALALSHIIDDLQRIEDKVDSCRAQ